MLSDSKFGFGLMRLPKNADNEIDIEQVKDMVDGFMAAASIISTPPMCTRDRKRR